MASPQTPRHSPHPSITTDYTNMSASSSPQDRRDISTPLRNSFTNSDGLDMNVFGSGGTDNGLGNLADELADALSEDEYYEEQDTPGINLQEAEGRGGVEGVRDSGVEVDAVSPATEAKRMTLDLPSSNGRGHRRKGSEYDGSEYGSDSDLDSPGMPPSLVARMDAVESLARRGTGSPGGPADNVFQRVTDGLRDLGSQSGVEGGASRLITAHSALTTHLSHQTRQLHSLTFPLFSPLVPPPDPETIDAVVPLLITLSDSMPRPSTSAYNSLSNLHSLTSDLVQTLDYLSDTLQMSRQTTTIATRRLKSAKEMVAEIRQEEELREEGERWLTRGNWGERLQNRECAGICGDVVGGFEEVCDGWRQRLLAQAESAQA